MSDGRAPLDTIENESLVLDLVRWVAREPRTYGQVMDAWRTSCPRLQIWEDALDCGFLAVERLNSSATMVRVTPAGSGFLESRGRR